MSDRKKMALVVGGLLGVTGIVLIARSAKGHEPPPTPPPGTGNLWGLVTDSETGSRVAGASVMLDGSLESITDSDGYYEFLEIELGYHDLTATQDGYEPWG
jgi:hypothetical protein